ncbi:hypothetical protein Tco_0773844 [Tanacetum coccineum]|uniref:Nucleolar protein 16 n=1 Tax=Tanacetum coccineum TaxID=301880 RepID=A0ABQ4ZR38_9ASTR
MEGHVTSDKSVKHIGKSKEVGTLRYLSLVVPLKNVGDEAVDKELGDRMEMAATTASSLEAEQESGAKDTILGDADAQTRFKTTSKQSNDPPLLRVDTLGSGFLQEQEQDEELAQKLHAKELVRIQQDKNKKVQNRSFSIVEVRKNMYIYLKNQGGYKQSHFKGMRYEDIRPIFERVWDQNHTFVPKDSEIEKEVMKISGFDLQQESSKQVEEEIVQQDDVVAEQVVKETSKKDEGRLKRKTSKSRKDKDKRQKNQDDP